MIDRECDETTEKGKQIFIFDYTHFTKPATVHCSFTIVSFGCSFYALSNCFVWWDGVFVSILHYLSSDRMKDDRIRASFSLSLFLSEVMPKRYCTSTLFLSSTINSCRHTFIQKGVDRYWIRNIKYNEKKMENGNNNKHEKKKQQHPNTRENLFSKLYSIPSDNLSSNVSDKWQLTHHWYHVLTRYINGNIRIQFHVDQWVRQWPFTYVHLYVKYIWFM